LTDPRLSIRRETSGPVRTFPCNTETNEWLATDNTGTPKFVAMLGDDFLDADDDLATLLGLLTDVIDGDVVVWENFATHCPTVATVVKRANRLPCYQDDVPVNDHTGGVRATHEPTTKPVAHSYEQALEKMIELRSAGMTMKAVAAKLNALGYPTRRGRCWTAVQVWRTLRKQAVATRVCG
jgi:hypothetical protein